VVLVLVLVPVVVLAVPVVTRVTSWGADSSERRNRTVATLVG
jgi:hypothetical protein